MFKGHPIITNTVIYKTLEQQPFYVLCYRIGFGGNPVHHTTMAHVSGQISIEISMYPGVVSTCFVDDLMNKTQRREAKTEVNY